MIGAALSIGVGGWKKGNEAWLRAFHRLRAAFCLCIPPHIMFDGRNLPFRMANDTKRKFKRVLLKLSGEALREVGSQDNISPPIVENIAAQIKTAHQAGLEIAVVVGGGNFWRGVSASNRAWSVPQRTIWACWPQ